MLSFTRYQVENWHTKSHVEHGSNPSGPGGRLADSYWVHERYESGSKDLSAVYIDLIEGFEKGRPIYLQNMPNLFPTQGDLIFGVQMIQTYLIGRLAGKSMADAKEAMKEYANVLKTKPLLIDREDVKESLADAEIPKYYPYPYLITDYATIEKAIMEKDPRYAYVEIVPMGTSGSYHLVVDAEKGVTIGYSTPLPMIGSGGRVTGRHLKNYTGFVEK